MESRLRRLSHDVPAWVGDGAVYHIRIRSEKGWTESLVDRSLAPTILDSVAFYQTNLIWNCRLMLLMPDHLHALIAFNPERNMSEVVRNWKRYHAVRAGIRWQSNYFDHRIRNETALIEKAHYIRMNPVVLGLCTTPEEWPWVRDDGVWI